MNKKIKLILSFLLCLVLASCVEKQEIDKLGIINARGIDFGKEEGMFETTLSVFQFSSQSQEFATTITSKGTTIDGAMTDAEHYTMYQLAPGKIKLSVFGKEVAEQGILPLLDNQARDARLPDLKYLSVSTTTAKEVLSVDPKKIPTDVGQLLHGLIENHSLEHNAPRKTLQDFLRIYYDTGQDNVLPLFKLEDGVPKLGGIALFQGDKMVGEVGHDENVFLNILERSVKEQVIAFTLPIEPFKDYLEHQGSQKNQKEADFSFLIKKGKSKIKLVDSTNLVYETDTKLQLRLLEQSAGIALKDSKIIKILEKEVEKDLEKRFQAFLSKLKKYEVDPIGYGHYYKSTLRHQELTREEWREKFPTIDVKFNVDVVMIQHGVID